MNEAQDLYIKLKALTTFTISYPFSCYQHHTAGKLVTTHLLEPLCGEVGVGDLREDPGGVPVVRGKSLEQPHRLPEVIGHQGLVRLCYLT